MSIIQRAALLAALAALGTTGTAGAATETKVFFHCANAPGAPAPLKIQNIGLVTGFPSWNGTPPTTSFQAGGGCGTVDTGALEGTAPRNFYDGVFSGVHAGAIDKMRFELHSLLLSQLRTTPTTSLVVKITLGSDNATFATAPAVATRSVTVAPVKSASGLTEMFSFTLENLGIEAEPDRVVTITLDTDATYFNGWVFDATEVPSGVTFVAPEPVPAP